MSEELILDRRDKGDSSFGMQMVQRCLWEIAANGGSLTKAHRSLERQEIHTENGKPPAINTLRKWKNVTYRNTYETILRTEANRIDELLSQQAQANAIALGDAVSDALEVTLSGLALANGVEASQILRNIAQARQIEIDKSMQLRGEDPVSRAANSFKDAMRELAGLGVVKVVEEDVEKGYIDAEVVHPRARELVAELVGED